MAAGQPPDDLKRLLDGYSMNLVNAMASFHGLAKSGAKAKPQAITDLARALVEPKRIQRSWDDLSAVERAALVAILQRGGKMLTQALREVLAQQHLIDPDTPKQTAPAAFGRPQAPPINARAPDSRRLEDILARLMLRGLVFAADDPSALFPGQSRYSAPKREPNQPVTRVFIPEPIRRHLPAPPPLTLTVTPAQVGAQRDGSARTFQRDIYLYWSFVRGQPLALTAKGEPYKPQLKEVNASLLAKAELGKGEGELDHPRLRFTRLMLEALGLARADGANRIVVSGDTAFFAQSAAERVRQSFEAWRSGSFFNELLLLPKSVRPPRLLAATSEVIHARQSVLALTRELAAGDDWLAFDTLISALRERDYEFLLRRPAGPDYRYSYNDVQIQSPYYAATNALGLDFPGVSGEADGWGKVEANFIRGVISGPLAWMGLADLGWASAPAGQEPAAFRLTALGRWLLAGGPQPHIPAEGGRVIVQPNLHITALDPVNDVTLVTLDRFAERLSAERAVEYRLTRASLYAGQRQGWDAARVQAFLRQQTGAELPGNVARTLDEWQAQHERIRLHARVVLVHGTPDALNALAQDPATAALVAGRPSPEVMLLKNAEAIPIATRVLGAHGLLPLYSRGAAVAANSVETAETGEIRLLARRPNLFLHGHLSALADPVGDDHYQISAATVARAVRAGLSAPQILERLQGVNRGPLPPGLARRVRAWARHYGEAALDEVVLLQVRDAATLAELLADPEIAGLLQPFQPAPKKALARVSRDQADRLRALLAERGVDLKDNLS